MRSILRFALLLALSMTAVVRADDPAANGEAPLSVRDILSQPTVERMDLLVRQHPNVTGVCMSGRKELTDDGIQRLTKLQNLQFLKLGPQVSTVGLTHVGDITSLRRFVLTGTQVTEAGARPLARLPNLELLMLERSQVEPDAWSVLATVPRLRRLSISHSELADADVAGLSKLTQIEWLSLRGPRLTAETLSRIQSNAELRSLILAFPLDEAGAQHLLALPRLESLTVEGPGAVETPAFNVLAKHPALRKLNVGPRSLTDADFTAIASCQRLHQLELGSETPQPVVDRLRAAMPNTVVCPYRSHTVEELKRLSKFVQVDADGKVAEVSLICGKSANDAKLAVLRGFPTIDRLRVYGPITDDGVKSLQSLRYLEKLNIYSPHLTDAGLQHLTWLHNLRVLQVRAPQVTDAGLAELKKSLPNCEINGR